MREGKYADGEKCLRAKIDMASPNLNLRDPVIYRILHVAHHRTGDKWCIYPMYDYAHPICDYLQGVTHSLCTLEFEDHRPLYDWVGINLGFAPKPRQIEFARLNITNLVMSKRYLKKLVEEGSVHGWDDPRMPTLAGLRNRGVPAAAIRDFCERAGVTKANSECEIGYFEAVIRDYLNAHAPRAMAVAEPLKLVITNYEGSEEVDFDVNQLDPDAGTRKVRFSGELYIDGSDFSLDPPPKYHRLKLGGNVRLKNAYIIRADEAVKDENGNVTEVRCTYFPRAAVERQERHQGEGRHPVGGCGNVRGRRPEAVRPPFEGRGLRGAGLQRTSQPRQRAYLCGKGRALSCRSPRRERLPAPARGVLQDLPRGRKTLPFGDRLPERQLQ